MCSFYIAYFEEISSLVMYRPRISFYWWLTTLLQGFNLCFWPLSCTMYNRTMTLHCTIHYTVLDTLLQCTTRVRSGTMMDLRMWGRTRQRSEVMTLQGSELEPKLKDSFCCTILPPLMLQESTGIRWNWAQKQNLQALIHRSGLFNGDVLIRFLIYSCIY